MQQILITLACCLALYGLVCALFYTNQARFIFFPTREVRLSPAEFGLPYEGVRLTTGDGVALDAWLIPPAPARGPSAPWVLVCHGNGGNISHRLDLARFLHRCGAGVLLFDYRGYGRSDGVPTEEGLYRDARAAWDLLTHDRGVAPARVVAWGESLGGGVASWLALEQPVGGLVLQSTFTALPDVGAGHYPWLPVRALCRFRFPSVERVGRIPCPKLVLHGPEDEMIPVSHGRALYEAAAPPKTWFELQGGHNTGAGEQAPEYATTVAAFLDGVAAAATSVRAPR